MKIGYPALGTNEKEKIMLSTDFTACDLIGIYDNDSDKIELTHKDELDISITDWVKQNNIDAIISPDIKAMALKVLKGNGIKVYQAEGSFLSLNIILLRSEMLPEFSAAQLASESSGSCGSCSSCSSTGCA